MWWPNIAAFAESFETYAVDNLYDFGRSVYTRKPQKPEDLPEWLNELFDALNLHAKINMAGLSQGGWMAGLYALHCPERVKKVALLAPANTILMIRPEFALRAVACLLPLRFFTRSFIYWLFSDLVSKDEASQRLADEMVAEMFLSFRCFKPMPIQSPTVFTDDELQKMKVPALFLVGEHEKIYPPQEAVQRIHRLAPHWETGIIPSAGHDLTFAQTEMVNKKVIEFFLG
jgi:pimeloyl-ACP methyl ester carboxylesterase